MNKKYLKMTFQTAAGKNMTLNLNDPKETLTDAEIIAAMDGIIAQNIFAVDGEDAILKEDAKIIDTTSNDLYDPE